MKVTTILILAIIILFLGIAIYYTFSSPLLISSQEAKKRIESNEIDVILDVRTDLEYNLGHYPGALHIPTSKLAFNFPQEVPDKEAKVLVYCNTGQRSRKAAETLHAMGYKNTRYIAGPYWSLTR